MRNKKRQETVQKACSSRKTGRVSSVGMKLSVYGTVLTLLLSGCSARWSEVTIVDEGNSGAVQVGVEIEERELETKASSEAEVSGEDEQETEEERTEETESASVPSELLMKLDISAEAYCILDGDTNTVIAGYRPNGTYAPASIVKILTALIVAEQCPDLEQTVTVLREDIEAIDLLSSTMNPMIREDEEISLRDLLYGMLLKSSNACAVVLARHTAGSERKFVDLMNARAEELGTADSHFANASGLDAEEQYVSARDMALIMKAALDNPVTAQILSTVEYDTRPTNLFGTRNLQMGHMMVNGDIPVDGVYAGKTGFTLNAGYTMVTAVKRDGHNLIAVTLGSTYGSNYADMETVIEYGFARLKGIGYISRPAAYTPRVAAMDETELTLQCQVSHGASAVKFAVWSAANGQDDLVWYDCALDETTATAHVPLSDHNGELGRYEAACYVTDETGASVGISIQILVTGRNLEKGIVTYGESAYYIDDDGRLRFGFIESPEGRYYADGEGRLQTGITGEADCKTLAGSDYQITDGFGEWEGQTYYVQKSGQLMTGRCAIDGKGYLFDDVSGILLEE